MGKIDKPWGFEEQVLMTQIDVGEKMGMLGIRRLVINIDEMTSYAYHDEQSDILYLLEGDISVRKKDDHERLEKGNAVVIRAGEKHQIQNVCSSVAKVLEISFPYDPEDIHRIEDPYNDERSLERSETEKYK